MKPTVNLEFDCQSEDKTAIPGKTECVTHIILFNPHNTPVQLEIITISIFQMRKYSLSKTGQGHTAYD